MARQIVPLEDVEKLENEFLAIAAKLRECNQIATEAGMSAVLIHVKTLRNLHLPEVKDWVDTAWNDVKLQANAYIEGRISKAEKSMNRSASQKKPAKKRSK